MSTKRVRPVGQCARCGNNKPIHYVAKRLCHACYKLAVWNVANRDKVKEYRRKHYANNRDAAYHRQRRYKVRNPEYRANWTDDREKKRAVKYGLTVDMVRIMERTGCRICGSYERLHIDHCHTTGLARGILCHHCNTGIGMLRDDITLMARAIEYLRNGRINHALAAALNIER